MACNDHRCNRPRWVPRSEETGTRHPEALPEYAVTSRTRADTPSSDRHRPDTIMVVRVVEAQYEDGVLRPAERLGLRPGERVSLIVVRRPDPSRWDLAGLLKTANENDLALAEQGLAEWADELDATERS